MICPMCERGETRPYVFDETIGNWDGKAGFLVKGLVGEECGACGSVTISPEQCRANRDKIAAERERLGW